MNQLKAIYFQLKLSDSNVIVIDMKKALINVICMTFSSINHVLCLWHINNNVLAHCKKTFDDKENWTRFFDEWKAMTYASIEAKFWKLWNQLFVKYNRSHEDCVKYLIFTYIANCRQFVTCFINKFLHFDIIVISRSENDHAILKRQLRSSSKDLKIVINEIKFLLNNQLHDHLIAFEEARTRFSSILRSKSIFRQLIIFVSSYALKKINEQYDLMINQFTILSACTNIFIIIMRLSCAHKIQERMWETKCLLLKDVHTHWRLIHHSTFQFSIIINVL